MRLFKDGPRTDDSPGRHAEGPFEVLSRSARPDLARVRALLEEWFARYPREAQHHMKTRLRAEWDGAWFELFLHELLLRLGCTAALHPMVPGVSRVPDFLVRPASGEPFYLEAAAVTEETTATAREPRAHAHILDVLNEYWHPDFSFWLEELEGVPTGTPSRKALHDVLRRCVEGLDADRVMALYADGRVEELPRALFDDGGLRFSVVPIPKPAAIRGRPGGRAVGVGPQGGGVVRPVEAIRAVVKGKARAYGTPEWPLVVAVNTVAGFGVARDDVVAALFGSEIVSYSPADDGGTLGRARDGVWTAGSGPTYTRLSAVLLAAPALPWNLPTAPICLYHNPWAARPYTGPLTRLPQAVPRDGHLEWREGLSTGALLGLPPTWPAVNATP